MYLNPIRKKLTKLIYLIKTIVKKYIFKFKFT